MDLSGHNSFRMKVSCRNFLEYDSAADLEKLDFEAIEGGVKHIGGGSNLLFTADFPGTILHSAIRFIEQIQQRRYNKSTDNEADDQRILLTPWCCSNGITCL